MKKVNLIFNITFICSLIVIIGCMGSMERKAAIQYFLQLYEQGRYNEAIKCLNTEIKEDPDDSVLLTIRGTCYEALGEYSTAVKDYSKAIVKYDSSFTVSNF